MPPTPVSGDVQLVADAANSAGIEVPLSGRQEQEQEFRSFVQEWWCPLVSWYAFTTYDLAVAQQGSLSRWQEGCWIQYRHSTPGHIRSFEQDPEEKKGGRKEKKKKRSTYKISQTSAY